MISLRSYLAIFSAVVSSLAISPSIASARSESAQAAEGNKPYLTVDQLRKQYGDARSRYMTIRGVEVHYKDEGRGPVLFMVHGSVSSLRTSRTSSRPRPPESIEGLRSPGLGKIRFPEINALLDLFVTVE